MCMADICACCGKKIPFLYVDYDYIKIDGTEFRMCRNCNRKIKAYYSGNISLNEIISDATNKNIADYFINGSHEKDNGLEKTEKEQIDNNMMERKNEIFYNDVHQIAGDLRFIKNIIIIGLAFGLILGIISALLIF